MSAQPSLVRCHHCQQLVWSDRHEFTHSWSVDGALPPADAEFAALSCLLNKLSLANKLGLSSISELPF